MSGSGSSDKDQKFEAAIAQSLLEILEELRKLNQQLEYVTDQKVVEDGTIT